MPSKSWSDKNARRGSTLPCPSRVSAGSCARLAGSLKRAVNASRVLACEPRVGLHRVNVWPRAPRSNARRPDNRPRNIRFQHVSGGAVGRGPSTILTPVRGASGPSNARRDALAACWPEIRRIARSRFRPNPPFAARAWRRSQSPRPRPPGWRVLTSWLSRTTAAR